MTNPIVETVNAWLAADGIDQASYRAVMRRWVFEAYDGDTGSNPVHALERGECTDGEFELALARELVAVNGGPVTGLGLLTRMFAASILDEAMLALIRRLRTAGVPTGLLSNSWGDIYPRELFPELFDAVVISCEVGMRKPEPRIFLHAARALGLDPADCVFIDDIQANVDAAADLGFTGVLHEEAQATVQRVADLLQIGAGSR